MRMMNKRHANVVRRQCGTAYVLVLSITTLLVTLGIAATQLAQNQIEHGETEDDLAKARLAAMYTQDYIHKSITGDDAWRDNLDSTNWRYFAELDGIKIWYNYVDEVDGDLTDDYSEPFVLYTLAVSGQASRIYSAEYTADADGNLTRNASTLRQEVFSQ